MYYPMRVTGILLLLILGAFAPVPVIQKKIQSRSLQADIDRNGNVYFVDPSLNLCLSPFKSDTIKKFSVSNYGSDPVIDAGNPLEIFVFFPSTGKIVIFDNQLNIQQELNIYNRQNIIPAAFGRCNDGNIWLMDQNSLTLKKFSRQGTLLAESVLLNKYVSAPGVVRRIADNGQQICLSDNAGNTFQFDKNLYLENTITGTGGGLVGMDPQGTVVRLNNCLIRIPFQKKSIPGNDTLMCNLQAENEYRTGGDYLLERAAREINLFRR